MFSAPSNVSSSSEARTNPILECPSCGALVWESESTGRDPKTKELHFSICCNQGLIKLRPLRQPPPLLEKLLQYIQFCETIRVYNALLAFTSIGAKLDYSVVFGRGSFTFRIQGQTYHRIGSLIPKAGLPPKYLQIYIFDTENENAQSNIKQYDLPQSNEVAGLIVGDMSDTICERDIIRDNHPLYMNLQYPLLFSYGDYGFNTEIFLHLEEGSSRTRKFLSIRQFYASQIQTRLKKKNNTH
ncbi:unnamed protein product [Brassica rapa]|uniref:Helitron helicase-like domain-containing protein n=1 Tax=Brassica campestris TaxID=3711 RepID=A0A8D9CWY1_BRACM|nr:unnamed protein product [Brassica rapa]